MTDQKKSSAKSRANLRARSKRKHRVVVLVAIFVIASAGVGVYYLLHIPFFSARVVHVTGISHTTRDQVLAAANLSSHTSLISINNDEIAKRIEQLPWVTHATVREEWPDGVEINIKECTAVAVLKSTAQVSADSKKTTTPSNTPTSGSTAQPGTSVPAGSDSSTSTTTQSTTPAGSGGTPTRPAGSTASTTTTTLQKTKQNGSPGPTTSNGSGEKVLDTPYALVSAAGKILQGVSVAPHTLIELRAPVVLGLPGTHIPLDAQAAMRVIETLPKAFSAQVGIVNETETKSLSITLKEPLSIELGSINNLMQKYEDAASILAKAHLAKGDVINVSSPQTPTVGEKQ